MALDSGPLREVPLLRTDVTVYIRQVFRPADGSQPDPFRGRPHEGRWPTPSTLYTATTEAVAWAEYCRNHAPGVETADVTGGVGLDDAGVDLMAHLEVPVAARALFELDFAFEALADLTSEWARTLLSRAGFSLDSFTADPPYGDCPALAALVDELGWQAIKVPSAAWQRSDGHCVPVFESGLAALIDHRMVAVSKRPTVALAVATHYATGTRPAWLS